MGYKGAVIQAGGTSRGTTTAGGRKEVPQPHHMQTHTRRLVHGRVCISSRNRSVECPHSDLEGPWPRNVGVVGPVAQLCMHACEQQGRVQYAKVAYV